jgi:hypothetical protein
MGWSGMIAWLRKKFNNWWHRVKKVSIANNPLVDDKGVINYEIWYVMWKYDDGWYGSTVGGATAEQAYHNCCTGLPQFRWPPFSKIKTFNVPETK